MSLNETIRAKAEKYANARASAGKWSIYKDGDFINGYRPRLGGDWISLGDGEPELYFKSDAIKAAREFKEKCKLLLESRP